MSYILHKQPKIFPIDPGKIQEPEITTLGNGVPVLYFNAGQEDIVQIDFSFDAGETMAEKSLVAGMAKVMLVEGTQSFNAKELNDILDYYGIIISPYCTNDKAGITFLCLNKYAKETVELAKDILFNPLYRQEEFDSQINKQRTEFLMSLEVVGFLAKRNLSASIFGKNHPYGRLTQIEDFDNLSIEDIKSFHNKYYTTDTMSIFVSGKINDITKQLIYDHFGDIKRTEKKEIIYMPPFPSKSEKLHIMKANALQDAIRIGKRSINIRETDYIGLMVINTILGGYFGSRLMKNIREEKGFTYGIGSAIASTQQTGVMIIASEVNHENTSEAIDEIFKEIGRLSKEPVGTEELDTVRNYMLGNIVRKLDGPFALAVNYKTLWEYGLDNTFNYKLIEKIKNISPDEIMSLAQTYYNIDDFTIVTAGEK